MDKRFKGTKEEYIEFRKKHNEANKRYYSKPEIRNKKKIYAKKYRVNNKEKISEYGKSLRAKPEVQERIKKWRKKNKEHLINYRKKLYKKLKKNGVKARIDKEYRKNNKEKLKQYRNRPETKMRTKKWYNENKEHLKQVRKKYYKTERGILSSKRANHIKLAIRKDRPTDLTRKKIKMTYDRDKSCVYCSSNKKLELDHIVPLVKGGSCMSNNLVVSCEKCNRSKHGRNVSYWCKLQGIGVPKIVLKLLKEQTQGIRSNRSVLTV